MIPTPRTGDSVFSSEPCTNADDSFPCLKCIGSCGYHRVPVPPSNDGDKANAQCVHVGATVDNFCRAGSSARRHVVRPIGRRTYAGQGERVIPTPPFISPST